MITIIFMSILPPLFLDLVGVQAAHDALTRYVVMIIIIFILLSPPIVKIGRGAGSARRNHEVCRYDCTYFHDYPPPPIVRIGRGAGCARRN
ncbi:hypothetical protein T492DRAFT_375608 [Pavlovales sp. CCMP2436]|nr:hypothetical protein T492DRAFT_375608 [Pavlovales sp. CCMP2436]